MARVPLELLLAAILTLGLEKTASQLRTQESQAVLGIDYNGGADGGRGSSDQNSYWNSQIMDHGLDGNNDNARNIRRSRSRWVAGESNCSCVQEMTALKRDLREEMRQRVTLKVIVDGVLSQLETLSSALTALNTTSIDKSLETRPSTPLRPVTFSAKLSYNRELKPLDVIVFDALLTNVGEAYDPDTGKFTAPLDGTYMFHSTILSGYNTKVETAIIANDKEVARIYSGAHDAHGSGSNMAALHLRTGDVVWVRLLYQGGNHVHGYYSTFTGTLLQEG